MVWATATGFERLGLNPALVSTAEAAVIGTVCALSVDVYPAVLGSLAVTPFTAGLRTGPRSVALALSAELTTLVPIALLLRGAMEVDQGADTFTWVVTGLGPRPDRELRAFDGSRRHRTRWPPTGRRRPCCAGCSTSPAG